MAKAEKRLWNLSQEEWDKEYYYAELKREMDIRAGNEIHYEKGFKKGLAEGMAKGMAEAREIRRKEGLAKRNGRRYKESRPRPA